MKATAEQVEAVRLAARIDPRILLIPPELVDPRIARLILENEHIRLRKAAEKGGGS